MGSTLEKPPGSPAPAPFTSCGRWQQLPSPLFCCFSFWPLCVWNPGPSTVSTLHCHTPTPVSLPRAPLWCRVVQRRRSGPPPAPTRAGVPRGLGVGGLPFTWLSLLPAHQDSITAARGTAEPICGAGLFTLRTEKLRLQGPKWLAGAAGSAPHSAGRARPGVVCAGSSALARRTKAPAPQKPGPPSGGGRAASVGGSPACDCGAAQPGERGFPASRSPAPVPEGAGQDPLGLFLSAPQLLHLENRSSPVDVPSPEQWLCPSPPLVVLEAPQLPPPPSESSEGYRGAAPGLCQPSSRPLDPSVLTSPWGLAEWEDYKSHFQPSTLRLLAGGGEKGGGERRRTQRELPQIRRWAPPRASARPGCAGQGAPFTRHPLRSTGHHPTSQMRKLRAGGGT